MKICSVEGCDEKHDAKGYCARHYQQMHHYGKIFKRTVHDPNEIIIKGDIAEIVLYNRKHKEVARAIIDAEDVEVVKKYKWHLSDQGYVKTKPKGKTIGIQYIIMGLKPNKKQEIDHKDRKPLNNRKSNYRVCTHSENMKNQGKQKDNTSGYKGVFKYKDKWKSQITANEKYIHLGVFKSRVAAALAYNAAAIKYHGKFACLNKI